MPVPHPGTNGQFEALALVRHQASAGQEDQLAGALPCCLQAALLSGAAWPDPRGP